MIGPECFLVPVPCDSNRILCDKMKYKETAYV
jgi:hypothetical protein